MTTDDRIVSGATSEPALLPKQEGAVAWQYPPAMDKDAANGWQIDFEYLQAHARESTERTGFDVLPETVEDILLNVVLPATPPSLPLLGEVVQEEAHGTKPSPSRAEDSATETAFREALRSIASFGSVNLSGEWDPALRGIIRSMIDCAERALEPEGGK